MKVTPVPLVSMVAQRHRADCGVAALSMMAGESYEETLLAFGDSRLLHGGVWMPQILRAAARLGVTLKKKVAANLEDDDGILQIRYRRGPQHVVLLREGLVFDTNAEVWTPSDYLRARKAGVGWVLVKAEQ